MDNFMVKVMSKNCPWVTVVFRIYIRLRIQWMWFSCWRHRQTRKHPHKRMQWHSYNLQIKRQRLLLCIDSHHFIWLNPHKNNGYYLDSHPSIHDMFDYYDKGNGSLTVWLDLFTWFIKVNILLKNLYLCIST
jgi:hypothetical protein